MPGMVCHDISRPDEAPPENDDQPASWDVPGVEEVDQSHDWDTQHDTTNLNFTFDLPDPQDTTHHLFPGIDGLWEPATESFSDDALGYVWNLASEKPRSNDNRRNEDMLLEIGDNDALNLDDINLESIRAMDFRLSEGSPALLGQTPSPAPRLNDNDAAVPSDTQAAGMYSFARF